MGALRILVADDHEVFRRGLRSLLESRSDWEICGEASNGTDAVDKAKELRPDVIVLDVNMPGMNGLDAARLIRKDVPESEVVILSQYEPSVMLRAALESGARTYVAKSQVSLELLSAVEAASKHKSKSPAADKTQVKVEERAKQESREIARDEAAKSFDCLSGGGEMGELMRAKDWSKTKLGPVERWPQSLKTAVSTCLNSRFAILVWWGPELVMLYNDAYREIIGAKHPAALGNPGRDCWPEIWDTIGPMLEGVIKRGEATWSDDLLLMLERYGYPEECYFTFSYSPIRDESGGVGGVFTPVTETTEKMIGERRLRTLRDLAARSAEAKNEDQMWVLAANILGENPQDLPFSLFYRISPDRKRIEVAASAGLGSDHVLCSKRELARPDSAIFEALREVAQSGEPRDITDLQQHCSDIPVAPWNAQPHTAVALPITLPGQHLPAGVLLAAVSPRKRLDETYRTFYDLIVRQVANSLAEARAYAEERRRAEALAELDRAKTAFFSNVSHEFRTPLTLMMGPLEDLLHRVSNGIGEDEQEQLEVVHRNGLRLLKLVNTLLDFSRIEAGRIQASYEPTDLARLTADLASVFRSAIERAGMKLTVNCPALPQPVYVDRDMWEKIVLNLLSNALKFTLHGEIAVELRAAGDSVELQVRDTGTGIPERELPHMFERFHRIEGVQARTQEGSGIGLALVNELVKLHGGQIRVKSKVGRGTTFFICLPFGREHLPADRIREPRTLASSALSAKPYVEEALRWLPGLEGKLPPTMDVADTTRALLPRDKGQQPASRVLVADDNADMRQYLYRLISEQYEVEAVADGQSALRAVRQHPPDLVVADVMMPRLDGFGLLREMRKDAATKEIPVVLLSARAGEDARVEGLQQGADDYLVKPFSAREFLARIDAHLTIARVRRDSREREDALLRESELERNRLQELFMQAPAPIGMLTGPEHRWTFVNPAYVKVTGRTSVADFIGKTIRESLPEIEGQGFLELLDRVYRTGTPFIGSEMKVMLNRGTSGLPRKTYFDFVYQPLRNISGGVEGVLVYAVDVTDRVLSRKLVERSEQYFRNFFRAAPVGAVMLDLESHRLLDVNERYGETTGFTRDELLGRDFLDLIHPEDRKHEEHLFEEFKRQPSRGYQSEARYVRKDGSVIWISLATNVVSNGTDGGEYVIGIAADITPRKRAEEARFRLAAIVESSDDAIVSKNLDGVITSWNAGAERIFGYTEAEAVGRPITLLIPPDLHHQEPEILRKLRVGERIEHFQTKRVRKDGKRIDVALTISPVKDAEGRVIGASKIARDVSEQVRTEAALRESETRLRLAQTAAHVGTWEWDLLKDMRSTSPELKDIFGIADDQEMLEAWKARVHPEDVAMVQKGMEEGYEAGVMEFEYRYRHPERGLRWFYCKGARVSPASGDNRMFGVLIDITERKLAEDALQQRETELRQAQRLAKVGSWQWDPERDEVQWSEELYRISGYDPAELPPDYHGEHHKLYTPESWKRLQAAVSEALKNGKGYEIDLEMICRDGSRKWVIARGDANSDASGRVTQLRGTVQDITERKLTEEGLRQSEEQFRALADTIPQLAWMANADGWIFWYNRRWYEYTGTTPEEMEGWGWQSVHDPKLVTEVVENWKRAIAKGELFEMEFPLRRADGSYEWFLTRSIPLRDKEEGRVLRWFGTNTNIHEQREARRALQESQERLNIALAASATGTFRWDPATGKFLEFDENLKRLFGIPVDQQVVTTENFTARVHPDDVAKILPAIERCREGEDFDMEYRVILPDGSVRWLYDRAKFTGGNNGEPPCLVGACTDITSRKLAEEELLRAHDVLEERVRERTAELERAEQSLRHLSGRLLQMQDEERRRIARELHDSAGQMIVSLDINLFTIKNEASKLSSAAKAALEQSMQVTQQMSRELRTISHLLHPPLLDEAGLESAIRWFVEGFAERSKIPVKLELTEELGRLARDSETTVFRLVQEALTNIHRHSGSPTAEIRITRNSDKITVEICDHGKGMPPDLLRATSGKARPGVGIQGMRERVRQLGGQLEIQSTSGGTVVRAMLPVAEKTERGTMGAMGLAS